MRKEAILAVLVFVLIMGCSKTANVPGAQQKGIEGATTTTVDEASEPFFTSETDKELLQTVLPAVEEDPDGALSQCERFTTAFGKEICYDAYVLAKMKRGQKVDSAFCNKLTDDSAKENCLNFQPGDEAFINSD